MFKTIKKSTKRLGVTTSKSLDVVDEGLDATKSLLALATKSFDKLNELTDEMLAEASEKSAMKAEKKKLKHQLKLRKLQEKLEDPQQDNTPTEE